MLKTKWNGLNRNKPPRLTTPKTRKRNANWKKLVIARAEYLIEKYGRLMCEYSGEIIQFLTTVPTSEHDAWGHHISGRRRSECFPDNVYIVKYKYHRFIEENHIVVRQEDFQGAKIKPQPIIRY